MTLSLHYILYRFILFHNALRKGNFPLLHSLSRLHNFHTSEIKKEYARVLGSVGIDLVDVTRIAKLLSLYGDRFCVRVLGPDEMSQLNGRFDRAQFIAGRFAAKEAAIKALGRYIVERPSLTKIQIVNDFTGRPSLDLSHLAYPQLARVSAQLSISHERSHAIAIVILTEES